MLSADPHVVVDHHYALEATQDAAEEGAIASFFRPQFQCCIISVKEDHWKWIGWIGIVVKAVVCYCVIDEQCSIFEHIDADKGAVLVVFHIN